MTPRVIVSIVAILAILAGLDYLGSRLKRANEADALDEKVTNLTKAAAENAEKVKTLEDEKQVIQLEAAENNRQWSNIRAEKNRPVCQLDDATRSLLKSASDWNPR